MKSVVRIVKREKAHPSEPLPPGDKGKNASGEREIATTIKSWIADRKQQKRLTEQLHMEMLIKFAQ